MKVLLIDGAKYYPWIPPSEPHFESFVQEHAEDIFGEQSIYFNLKKKLKSQAGIASIPDGYVITVGQAPLWHIVEVELSSHDLYQHIVTQVSKFLSGIRNLNAQRTIATAIYEEINGDDFLRLRFRRAIDPNDTHKFLFDLITQPPILTVIIEEVNEQLREALAALRHEQIRVVEFQTFERADVGIGVHAHLYEPLLAPAKPPIGITTLEQPTAPTPTREKPERYGIRRRFWDKLLEKAREKTALHAGISPGEFSYVGTGAGKGGLIYYYYALQHRAGVELYIDRGKDAQSENEAIFEQLSSHKQEVEQVFGATLDWMRLEGKRACRITGAIEIGGYRDEEKWDEVQAALIDMMIRFEKSLKPHIMNLKS